MISSSWGVGHVFPMIPTAQALLEAGHEVRWVTHAPSCGLVRDAGIEALEGGLDAAGIVAAQQRLRLATTSLPGPEKAAYSFPHLFGELAMPAMVEDLLAHARAWSPDLLIHEPAELAAPLVAAILKRPCVTHSWGGAQPAEFLSAAGVEVATVWHQHGQTTPPYAGSFAAGHLDICPPSVQPVSLEHVAHKIPMRAMGYSGPVPDGLPTYLNRSDPRPLIYLTLGTVFNAASVLATAIEGIAAMGVRVLATVGSDGDPEALGAQPENVCVQQWVPQDIVLKHAAAVVSHAGSGTFLGALAQGIPQVCLPQAADQFRNTMAGVRIGAALGLTAEETSVTAVGAAVQQILDDKSYTTAAQTVAAEMSVMPTPREVIPELVRVAQQSLG